MKCILISGSKAIEIRFRIIENQYELSEGCVVVYNSSRKCESSALILAISLSIIAQSSNDF